MQGTLQERFFMDSSAFRPMSPCVNICTLDDEQVCIGCLRRLEEIIAWATMSGEEPWALIDELCHRFLEYIKGDKRHNTAALAIQ